MEKFLKISVITPSFNQGQFIEDNIKSVLNQNYPNFEHIIMDGGSTDNTIEILKKYKHIIWRSEPDKGQSHALNKTLEHVTGDVICWLNSDDKLCDSAFKIVNDFFIKNPDKKIVVGNIVSIDENNNFLSRDFAREVTYDGLLNGGQCVQQMSTFFKTEVLKKTGKFDENLHYTMDHDLWIRMAQYFKFYTIEEDLAMFRKYKDSKTGTSELKFVKELFIIKKKYKGKIFTVNNILLLNMYIKEPFKKIKWFRSFIRKLKNKNPNFYYFR